MYRLFFLQFLRTRTCQLGLVLLLVLGGISLVTGKQFLVSKQRATDQVIEKQLDHIERNVEHHKDDLSLLLYYLKFTLVNKTSALVGLSIGQKDINQSVQRVKILTLEGQKYDSDLVNPTQLLYGNLDLSFIIIYVFPLLVIAFTYNLFSEEEEAGIWKIVKVMAKSEQRFLIGKLGVRFLLLTVALLLLLGAGVLVLNITVDSAFGLFVATSWVYLLFWFALCFAVVSFKQNSNFNALSLLSAWLFLVMLLPALVNNFITTQYPIPEAFTAMIKQRDGYHEKWDTNKQETLEKFYKDYPSLAHFGFPPEQGFHWGWYYAMQHLGDSESREESQAMQQKIRLRERVSRMCSQFIPSMHTQFVFNDLAGSGLLAHMDFLDYTNDFHEKTRLYFYPKIFADENSTEGVDWDRFKPEFLDFKVEANWLASLLPLLLSTVLLLGLAFVRLNRN